MPAPARARARARARVDHGRACALIVAGQACTRVDTKVSVARDTLFLHHSVHDGVMRIVGGHCRKVGHFDFHLGGPFAAVAETERASIAGPGGAGGHVGTAMVEWWHSGPGKDMGAQS